MKNIWIILLLALLTAGSYFLLKNLQKETVEKKPEQQKVIIATARGVTASYYNEKNKLQYNLISPKVIEFSTGYGMEFLSPNLTAFDNEFQPTWKGTSDMGFLSDNKNNLLLKKNVKIVESPRGEKPTYINGEVMDYDAVSKLITSQLPVKIDDGMMVQLSNKLRLDTGSKKLDATHRVRARYQTKQATTKEAKQ